MYWIRVTVYARTLGIYCFSLCQRERKGDNDNGEDKGGVSQRRAEVKSGGKNEGRNQLYGDAGRQTLSETPHMKLEGELPEQTLVGVEREGWVGCYSLLWS